ncbi:ZIP family metal transporter [Elongatibacter sediminis]|uniref:ZIP family metal transporter n=1 Tax=Elongatibacter sediminis TaxID=3119006 RepID=A0AAW9RAI5_9GAMM
MNPTLTWILVGGIAMSAIAMIGGISVLLPRETLQRLLLPSVSVAAGTLFGGALFHMIPEGGRHVELLQTGIWIATGFSLFLALELFLQWHHSHRPDPDGRRPFTFLVLIGDGLHNFLGGLAIGSTFLLDPRAGIMAWIAAAAHEIPQEFGDFGCLVHGGWSRRRALLFNFISALTFPIGALLAYFASRQFEVSGLVLLGAGNFIYIAASDLIPEIKTQTGLLHAMIHLSCFVGGLGAMLAVALLLGT